MPIKDYSITPSNNNSAPPNGAPEGMSPASINNVIRQIMADMRQHAENGGWFNYNLTPTYIATNKFSVTDDKRDIFKVGRNIRASLSGSDVVSSVLSTAVVGNTTQVTIKHSVLNNTMASFELGFEPDVLNILAGVDGLCTATSVSNGNTITLIPHAGLIPDPLLKGTRLRFYADSNNAGAVTINNKALRYDSSGTLKALTQNYIQNGKYYEIDWDGTQWVITKGLTSALGSQGLSLRATLDNGKFFARKLNGDLPTGIDASKVWTLAEQKASIKQPTGDIFIEVPIGRVTFKDIAGSGSAPSTFTGVASETGSYGGRGSSTSWTRTFGSTAGTGGTLKDSASKDLFTGDNVQSDTDGFDAGAPVGGASTAPKSTTRTVIVDMKEGTVLDYTLGDKATSQSHTFRVNWRSYSPQGDGSYLSYHEDITRTSSGGDKDGEISFSY